MTCLWLMTDAVPEVSSLTCDPVLFITDPVFIMHLDGGKCIKRNLEKPERQLRPQNLYNNLILKTGRQYGILKGVQSPENHYHSETQIRYHTEKCDKHTLVHFKSHQRHKWNKVGYAHFCHHNSDRNKYEYQVKIINIYCQFLSNNPFNRVTEYFIRPYFSVRKINFTGLFHLSEKQISLSFWNLQKLT